MEYCIAHNPLLLQLLGHWFTLISRKCEHLAVEDFIIKDLPDSRGSRSQLLPCFPHLYLDYITHLVICQALFLIFFGGNGGARPSKSRVRAELNRLAAFPKPLTVPIPLAFVPLLYHNLGDLSRGFFIFFRGLFSRLRFCGSVPIPDTSARDPQECRLSP